ncbi:MAG: B12-binding domain-containing protein [Anaerolineae bacterium]
MVTGPHSQLLDLIQSADRRGANALIDEWAGVHGYERAVIELLDPVLQAWGEKWAAGEEVSLAQGYIAGKIAEDVLLQAAAERTKDPAPGALKGPVVMGSIEDDFHSLGRRLVTTFLCADGWEVCDLGNDVLASEFVDQAVEIGAKIVGASAMMYTNAMNIKKVRAEIDRRGLTGRLQLAVGGAVFVLRPELAAQVGGDGTARTAIGASDLMAELWDRAEVAGGGE